MFPVQSLAGPLDGPHVLITAGVHGDEFAPMLAVRALADRLDGRLRRGRLTLVPVVNVPAARLGRRTGEDGLDLARTCPGRSDGSATERIAHALSERIRSADAYIDLHDGGLRFLVLPLAGYMLHPDPALLDAQRRMARAFGLPFVWGTDPTLEGRSLSVARDAGVPAIYAEFQGGGHVDPAARDALVQGCRNVLAVLGLLDEPPAEPPSQRIIEDPRPNSGHMQIQHPAPTRGLFEPIARLGGTIGRGEPLGRLIDPAGAADVIVPSEREGRVLVLRVFPAVEPGESLGVVVDDVPL